MRKAIALLAAQLAAYAVASPVPANNKLFEKKDVCTPTPVVYALITPSPYGDIITVTEQGQAVSTCIPEYVVCTAGGSCNTEYSTSSYNWYSTVIPCYSGYTTVTAGNQMVNFYGHQTYGEVSAYACPTAGIYDVAGSAVIVDTAPTTLYYAPPVEQYFACPYSDYYEYVQSMSGGYSSGGFSSGVGYSGGAGYSSGGGEYSGDLSQLEVTSYSCYEDVCEYSPQTWVFAVQVYTETVQVPVVMSYPVDSNGEIVINDGPFVDVTINISNAPTTIILSTIVDHTKTITKTETITKTGTVTKTTTKTATTTTTATIAPTTPAQFVLSVAFDISVKKRATTGLKTNGYVGLIDGIVSVVTEKAAALVFFIDNDGHLKTGYHYVSTTQTDVNAGFGHFEIDRVEGDYSRSFSLEKYLNDEILRWKNLAFGDNLVKFGVLGNLNIINIFEAGSVPTDMPFTSCTLFIGPGDVVSSSSSTSISSTTTTSSPSSTSVSVSTTSSISTNSVSSSTNTVSSSSGLTSSVPTSSTSASSVSGSSVSSSVMSSTSSSVSPSASPFNLAIMFGTPITKRASPVKRQNTGPSGLYAGENGAQTLIPVAGQAAAVQFTISGNKLVNFVTGEILYAATSSVNSGSGALLFASASSIIAGDDSVFTVDALTGAVIWTNGDFTTTDHVAEFCYDSVANSISGQFSPTSPGNCAHFNFFATALPVASTSTSSVGSTSVSTTSTSTVSSVSSTSVSTISTSTASSVSSTSVSTIPTSTASSVSSTSMSTMPTSTVSSVGSTSVSTTSTSTVSSVSSTSVSTIPTSTASSASSTSMSTMSTSTVSSVPVSITTTTVTSIASSTTSSSTSQSSMSV